MWVFFALSACLTSATVILLLKAVGQHLGNPLSVSQGAAITGAVMLGAGMLGAAILLALPRHTTQVMRGHVGCLAAATCCLVLTHVALVVAVNRSSNPGFAHLVVNFNVVLVVLASTVLFGSRLGWQAGLGVAVTILGLALVLCS